MRCECGELTLQLVQTTELPVLDRPLEERGDQRAEGREQVDLRGVEREALAALVTRQESEAASVADQRDDHERADSEPARDLLRDRLLAAGILDEDGPPCRERILERAELRGREGGRQRTKLGRRQAVRREWDERRRLGDVADDSDPFEREAAGDCGARTLEHRSRAELPSRQRACQNMEGLELDVRLTGHVSRWRHRRRRDPL